MMTTVLSDSDAAGRMELMHQAETLLCDTDCAIAPLYYYSQPTWCLTVSTACTTPRWATSSLPTLPWSKELSLLKRAEPYGSALLFLLGLTNE